MGDQRNAKNAHNKSSAKKIRQISRFFYLKRRTCLKAPLLLRDQLIDKSIMKKIMPANGTRARGHIVPDQGNNDKIRGVICPDQNETNLDIIYYVIYH